MESPTEYLRAIGRRGGSKKTKPQTEARIANIQKALSKRWGKPIKLRRNKT